MKFVYFVSFGVVFYVCFTNAVRGLICEKRHLPFGEIYGSAGYETKKCWIIQVPQDSYVHLDLKELNLNGLDCAKTYVKITINETDEDFTFCSQDVRRKAITALSDVTVTYAHYDSYYRRTTSFRLYYKIENLICAQKDHFRCSNNSCIHQYQVCNGIEDCENGIDEIGCETGINAVKGVNVSRQNAINWLKNQRSVFFGWGKNTHRAVIAMYLAEAAYFRGDNLDEELSAKQLELQTSVALLRNSTDLLTASELSMFINALMVTCHNPRHFYGHDLLQILSERTINTNTTSPGAYLTLCNSNRSISESHVRKLLTFLEKDIEYPFALDIQAITVMALTCIQNKFKSFDDVANATEIYERTVKRFVAGQLSDGSFGNVYTTALVTQALISSGQINNKLWNVTATVKHLMQALNSSSIDFLSTYLILPILSGRSLLDIATVDCTNNPRKHGEDDEIFDVTNKLGGKMRIQYSLYLGDQKDVIHTIYLRMPENSSAYDIMRIAQVADPKYKFLQRNVLGSMYIYQIAGITNDPEAGKFWLLYTGDIHKNGTFEHYTQSPDQIFLDDNEHLIMWYKTVDV